SYRDFVSESDVTGAARQVDSHEYPGYSADAASAGSARAERERRERSDYAARTHGSASRERSLRGMPQGDGPDRIFAGKLRCHRAVAGFGRRLQDRSEWSALQRNEGVWP